MLDHRGRIPIDRGVHHMDDFDPYAEPKLDLEQTKRPPAPRLQSIPRQDKVASRAEFQDVDPHVTLSFNGSSPQSPPEVGTEGCFRYPQRGYRVQSVWISPFSG